MDEIYTAPDGSEMEEHGHIYSDGTKVRMAWNPTSRQFVAALPDAPAILSMDLRPPGWMKPGVTVPRP